MLLKYNQIHDLDTIYSLIRQHRDRIDPIDVEFADGTVLNLPFRRTLFHIFFWNMLHKNNIPILPKHILNIREVCNIPNIAEMQTLIYQDFLEHGISHENVVQTLWESINYMDHFIGLELAEYQESVNMYDLAEIALSDKVLAVRDKDIDISKGVQYAEAHLNYVEKELMRLLTTPGELSNDSMYVIAKTGILNAGQLRQLLGNIGCKTDVNDTIIQYFIKPSFVEGMTSIEEYVTEANAARKAAFNTHDAIEKSQYFGRKQHLITLTHEHVYPGDCGNTSLVRFNVTERNHRSIEGKTLVIDGLVFPVRHKDSHRFIGKTVFMRSVIDCKASPTGACEACRGLLTMNISTALNAGMISSICTIDPVTQGILSSKHHAKTDSIEYMLSENAELFIRSDNNLLYFKPDVKQLGNWHMSIPLKNMRSLQDILHIDNIAQINERKFSDLDHVLITDSDGTEYLLDLDDNDVKPYLTKRALLYMKDVYDHIEADDQYIKIPMKTYSSFKEFPFFKTTIMSDSLMAYVDTVRSFLETKSSSYTSVSELLQDFSDMVNTKVTGINILHLETILKNYLVTNEFNWDVAVVQDNEVVHFGRMDDIISSRTIGGELAFESHNRYFQSPQTYLTTKSHSPFDTILGLQ